MSPVRLSNGIPAYLVPVLGTEAVTVLIMVKVGSRYESAPLSGASHFIEHMMFKGSTKLPTPTDVSRALDAIGADYNAYTSKEYTGYYVKCDASHEKFAIDTLYDMTFDSLYNQAEMDRERRVIIEEIHMYEDTPVRHIEDLLEGAMFGGNTLGEEIAGSPETMKTMSREEVMEFRDTFYLPSRMSIAVAGKLNEDTKAWLEATFGRVAAKETPPAFTPFGLFPSREAPMGLQTKTTEQVHLGLGFPGLAYTDPRLPAMKLLVTILGGNMSSRLFMSVREQGGLAYRIRADHSEYEDVGITSILAGLDKTRLSEAAERIFKEVDDIVASGPTDEEVARAKEYLKGHILMGVEDSSVRAEWFAKQALFHGEVKTPEEKIVALQAITREDIKKLASEVLVREKMAMSFIGDGMDESSLRSLMT